MPRVPSEWSYSNVVAANNAIVTVPAARAGIRHVLTHLTLVSIDSGGGLVSGFVDVTDGIFGVGPIIFQWVLTTNAAAGTVDRDSFDNDIVRIGSPATQLEIRFAFSNSITEVIASGYDL